MEENYIYVYKLPDKKYICFVSLRDRHRANEIACLLTGLSLNQVEYIGKLDPDEEGTFIEIGKIDNPCPDCGLQLKALWSGVKCPDPKCGYWFCW